MRRLCKQAFRILLYLLFGVILLIGIGVLVLQTPFVQNRLRNFLAETASSHLNATITIDDLEGNLLSDLTLRKIRLELPDGSQGVFIEKLSIRYLLPKLFSNIIHIDRLSVNGLHLDLAKSADGVWRLPILPSPSPKREDKDVSPFPFRVDVLHFGLSDSQITLRQGEAEAISVEINRLSGKFKYGESILLSILDSSLAINPPDSPQMALSCDLSYDPVRSDLAVDGFSLQGGESRVLLDGNCRFSENSPAFSFSLSTHSLHLADLSRFFPSPGMPKSVVSGTLQVSGTPKNFRHDLSLEFEGATLKSEGAAGFDDDRGIWAELSAGIRSLDLSKEWFPYKDIVSGSVSTDLHLTATGLQSVESIDANVSADLRGPAVSGIFLDNVRLSAAWSGERLSNAQLDAVSGSNHLNISGGFNPTTREANADLNLDLVDAGTLLDPISKHYPGIFDSVTMEGETNAAATLEGAIDQPSIRFSIFSQKPGFKGYLTENAKITGRWKGLSGPGHRIDDLTLSLQNVSGNQLHARDLSLKGAWSGWLENPVADFSLSALDVSHDRLRMEALTLEGTLQGSPASDNSAVRVVLSSSGILYNDIAAAVLKLSANWHGPVTDPSGRAVIETEDTSIFGERFALLALAGDISHDNAAINISASHENGSIAEVEGIVSSFKSNRKPISIGKLRVTTASPWPEVNLSNTAPLNFFLEGDNLSVEDCRLSVNDADISLHGVISPSAARDLTLQTKNLEIETLPGAWNKKARLSGTLSADTTLSGPWNRPSISSDIRVAHLTGYDISQATDLAATVVYTDTLTSIHATLAKQGTTIFSADGRIPLVISLAPFSIQTNPDNLEATIRAKDLRFSELPIPEINGIEWDALTDMNISLSGNVLVPDVNGNIWIRDGHLALTRNRLTYESIAGSILLSNDSVTIEDLLIEGDHEGRLKVGGTFFLHQGHEFDADLIIRGDNFYVPFQKAISARISPDLHLSGGLKTPRLTGQVTVNESRINLDRLSHQQRSDIQVVESSDPGGDTQLMVASSSEKPGFFDPLSADILVRVPKNAWLKGQDVNAEISGEITVTKQSGGPFLLTGPLNTLRGNYYFMGKNFQLTKGNLEFLGLKEINPDLNIEARTRIKSATIIVTLGGTARDITVDLSSDPSMDESDIISYLIFGRPTDNLGGDQAFSVEKTAMKYAGGLLAVELRDLLGGVEFIDTFSIDPGSDENGFGTVTFGKYITPELFVSRSQSLSENEASYQDISYELTPSIKLESQIGKDYSNSVDLTWEFDF